MSVGENVNTKILTLFPTRLRENLHVQSGKFRHKFIEQTIKTKIYAFGKLKLSFSTSKKEIYEKCHAKVV